MEVQTAKKQVSKKLTTKKAEVKKIILKDTITKGECKSLEKALAYVATQTLPDDVAKIVDKAQTIANLLKVSDPKFNALGYRANSATYLRKAAPIDVWILGLVNGKYALDAKSIAALLDCRKQQNTNGKVPTLKAWCDKIIDHMHYMTVGGPFIASTLAHQYDTETRKKIAKGIKEVAEVVRLSIMEARKAVKAQAPATA